MIMPSPFHNAKLSIFLTGSMAGGCSLLLLQQPQPLLQLAVTPL
jgi:hypothetical protein